MARDPARSRALARQCPTCAPPEQRPGTAFGRLLPLLLILSLMANVIDAVRCEPRGAAYSQVAPATRRRPRRRSGRGVPRA